jgi:elongation factor 1-beta
MGKVAVSYRLMPTGVEVDLGAIRASLERAEEAALGGKIYGFEEMPIAFGLKALVVKILMDDKEGVVEKVERFLACTKGVQSVEVLETTLV